MECETGHIVEDIHWSWVRGFGCGQVIGKCVNDLRKTNTVETFNQHSEKPHLFLTVPMTAARFAPAALIRQ